MSKCIITGSSEFKSLTEMSGISSIELAAKMNLWMEENNTDVWPTLEQLGLRNKLVKDGVDFVFEQNPELSTIGNQQQYSQYLETIFPNSKVKDIVYHGSPNIFDEFSDEFKGKNTGTNRQNHFNGEDKYSTIFLR